VDSDLNRSIPTTLHARPTCSSKVEKLLGLVKDFAPVLSEGGEEVNDWEWRQDGSCKQRVVESLLGRGTILRVARRR